MVKVAWFQEQQFSFYRRFKIHARHDFGLIGRVGAVTTSRGHDVTTLACPTRARVLPRAVAQVRLQPDHGLAIARRCGPLRCCSTRHHAVVTAAVALPSYRGAVTAALSHCHAMLLPP